MSKSYKIVKIISEYKVVINVGSNSFVKEGDTFEVFEPGAEVFDPDTKESLGTLDYVKAKLRVTDVFPKMSVCENREGTVEKSLFANLTWTVTEQVPLDVQATDISGGYEGVSQKIKVGDLVRKVN